MAQKSLIKIHSRLSWILLEAKCLYYKLTGTKYEHLRIDDQTYDFLESKYRKLCKKLKKKDTISTMVGFDEERQSSQLVYRKLKNKKKRLPIKSILKKLESI